MELYHNSISKFISDLGQSIRIISTNQMAGYYVILTERFRIFIYLADQSRNENDGDVRTIHLDVDQILSIPSKLLARLRGLHGIGERIYARQTVVARVDKKVALSFQDEHHIQLAMPGKYRYGLFHEGELVSVAIFSGGRHMRDQDPAYRSFELIRFCHKGDRLIVGGLSKLLKSFIKDFNPQDIMTYADLDWTQDSSLHTIGFETIGQLAPLKYYLVDGVRQFIKPNEGVDFNEIENLGSLKLKLII